MYHVGGLIGSDCHVSIIFTVVVFWGGGGGGGGGGGKESMDGCGCTAAAVHMYYFRATTLKLWLRQ